MRRALVLLWVACAARAGDPINLDFKNTPVKNVVMLLGQLHGATIALDPEYQNARLTLKTTGVLDVCMAQLAEKIGAKLFHDGATYHIVPEWKYWLLKRLHDEKVTFAFKGESLRKILSVIITVSGVSAVIDPQLGDPGTTVDVANVPAFSALASTLAGHAAGFDLRHGVVFIATKKRLAALPKRMVIDVPEPLRIKRFLLSVMDETAARILSIVAKQAKLTLVIDKGIAPALAKRNITLHLIDVPIQHALAAVLTPAGAKAEIADGKLTVTSAAAAK